MDKPKIETITIEAAVARMINLDVLPSVVSPFEVTQVLHTYAVEAVENARGNTTKENLRVLLRRALSCKARHIFTLSLLDALEQEVEEAEYSMIEVVDQSGDKLLLSLESVSRWAYLNFCMKITDWTGVQKTVVKVTKWEDCMISIYRDFKIGLFKGTGDYTKHLFQDFELMGRRKKLPNKIGRLLIWLSQKKPTSKFPEGITRKDISKLRDALKQITELSGDPFFPLNEENNYKPRFKLINARRKGDERAREIAEKYGRVSLEDEAYKLAHGEARDFEEGDDEAAAFIRKAEDDYR